MIPSASSLPELIAVLNGISLVALLSGFWAVRTKRLSLHRILMLAALVSSTLFLTVYLIHHAQVGSVPYPHHDWTRVLYFVILIPHILLAVGMLPLIYLALRYAFKNELEKHRRVVRYAFPIWTYVSFTGLIVYFMLYQM